MAPRRQNADWLPADPRERTGAYAGLDGLRFAVARSDAACRKAAAAPAWDSEPIVRFLSSALGDGPAGVRMSDSGLIGDQGYIPRTTARGRSASPVGPEGDCACRTSSSETHLASTAADSRSFEAVLKNRLAEVGVAGWGDSSGP